MRLSQRHTRLVSGGNTALRLVVNKMASNSLTLDEFVEKANAHVESFAASKRAAMAEGDDRIERRTMGDWLREVGAYEDYVDLSEELARDRRTNVERRTTRRVGNAD